MPFDIQYGPIGAAVMLGYRGGQGEYNQKQFQNDMSFMGTLNDQQRTADARRATDMQNALGYYEANSRNNLASAQMQQAAAFHGAELGIQSKHLDLQGQQLQALSGYRGGILSNREENSGIRRQALSDKEDATQQKNDAIGQLPPEVQAYVKATGHAPPTLDHASEYVARSKELQVLQQQANDLAKQKQNVATEETNPITKAKTGKIIPRPGQEQSYQQWLAQSGQVQGALQQKSAEMQDFLQGKILPRTMQISPQQQAATAQAASGGMNPQQRPQVQMPQFGPDGNVVPGSRGQISPDIAAQYLQRVGGSQITPAHIEQAKAAARADGYIVP